MATQLQLRRDTLANWTSVNPILAQGETALVTDLNRIKYGNGTSTFTALPYVDSTASTVVASLTLTNTAIYSYHTRDTNGAIIFDNILKDNLQRKLTIKNTGVSGTIAITIPTPRGGLPTATIPFGWFCDIVYDWTGVYWNVSHQIYEVAL
jgi:hypothetical protein